MNTQSDSLKDGEIRIRNYVHGKVTSDMLYAFDFTEGTDVSVNEVGVLLEQDQDFWLFEPRIARTGRAGPSWVSPRRAYGELDVTLFTKAPRDKVKFTGKVESVADWFQDQTISGIRFRTFTPTDPVAMHGFTAYSGVINYEFEINKITE